jgi:hypothetical protein
MRECGPKQSAKRGQKSRDICLCKNTNMNAELGGLGQKQRNSKGNRRRAADIIIMDMDMDMNGYICNDKYGDSRGARRHVGKGGGGDCRLPRLF